MSEPTTNDNASIKVTPEQEIAQIEQAMESEAGNDKPGTEAKTPSEFEQLAAKKGWNNPDELAKAYQELESKLTPQSRELKELKEMVKEIQKSTAKPEIDPLDELPDDQKEALSLIERIIEKKLSPLLKRAEVEDAGKEIEGIKKQFPGSTDSEVEQAISLMEKYKSMPLGDAMKLVTYEKAKTNALASEKKAAMNKQNNRAFAESASDARKSGDTDYSKMTLEELESILPR